MTQERPARLFLRKPSSEKRSIPFLLEPTLTSARARVTTTHSLLTMRCRLLWDASGDYANMIRPRLYYLCRPDYAVEEDLPPTALLLTTTPRSADSTFYF